MIDNQGKRLVFASTVANVDDRKPVPEDGKRTDG